MKKILIRIRRGADVPDGEPLLTLSVFGVDGSLDAFLSAKRGTNGIPEFLRGVAHLAPVHDGLVWLTTDETREQAFARRADFSSLGHLGVAFARALGITPHNAKGATP